MKSVSILITNYNSYEAIETCLLSISKRTRYPHELIVYDDCSDNGVDLEFLRRQRDIGWIELVEGKERLGHGGGLDALINGFCKSDIAVILDCDIMIKEAGWLEEAVALIDDKTILACGLSDVSRRKNTIPLWLESWFMVLNMEAYRDGMQVGWTALSVPEQGLYYPNGFRLQHKIKFENPKGYKLASPLPTSLKRKYLHFVHASCLGTLNPKDIQKNSSIVDVREGLFNRIRVELNKLKGEP